MKQPVQLKEPLAPHAAGFRAYLESHGYGPESIDAHLRLWPA